MKMPQIYLVDSLYLALKEESLETGESISEIIRKKLRKSLGSRKKYFGNIR